MHGQRLLESGAWAIFGIGELLLYGREVGTGLPSALDLLDRSNTSLYRSYYLQHTSIKLEWV